MTRRDREVAVAEASANGLRFHRQADLNAYPELRMVQIVGDCEKCGITLTASDDLNNGIVWVGGGRVICAECAGEEG